jgi:uncharacterized protein (DUF302 family)
MSFHLSKKVNLTFDLAESRIREELKNIGFGVLTEIDVRKTLKEKINADFRDYKILGACNPKFAYEALNTDDKIGVMLPCSVVIQQHNNGVVEVSIMNPTPFMALLNNDKIIEFAKQVEKLLESALDKL